MRRSLLNYFVDAGTALLILALAVTGLLLEFVLPPGTSGRRGGAAWTLWDRTRHDWGEIHFYIACGLGVLLVVHVALHWTWVCALTRRIVTLRVASVGRTRGRDAVYGIAFLGSVSALVGGLLWLAGANVAVRYLPKGGGRSAGELRRALHLPETTLPDERLGRLCRRYGMSMSDVRTVLESPDATAKPTAEPAPKGGRKP